MQDTPGSSAAATGPASPAPRNPNRPNTRKTTLAALSRLLPLGVTTAGGLCAKDVTFRPWRMREEKELASLQEEHKGLTGPQFATLVLATMCPSIGGLNLENMKMVERRMHIGQMFMGDVLTAYFHLRIHALGKEFPIKIACRQCADKFTFNADLETLEVTAADTVPDSQWRFKLTDPFKLRGKDAEEFVMGPPRWNAIEAIRGGGLSVRPALFPACIHEVVGQPPAPLASHELDDMSKRDVERLSREINDLLIGPDMSVEITCPTCRAEQKTQIEWNYGSFFMTSSK